MGKLFAILAASAVVAGGATFAFYHHINPYSCPLSSCEVSKAGCCATPAVEPESPADLTVAAAGPVALFATVPVSAEVASCCATKPVAAVRASCCSAGAACCATVEACCPAPGFAAVVGPAAAVR